jgi:hypothetical protein
MSAASPAGPASAKATPWHRIAGGFAMNLDGTDASAVFTLPRVEVRASPKGWRSECLLADGRRGELAPPYLGGAAAAMADAVPRAQRLVAASAPPPLQAAAPLLPLVE